MVALALPLLGVWNEARAANPGASFSFGEVLVSGEGVAGLAVADLDGDGIQELLGAEPAADRVVIWVPNGSGGLRIINSIACPSPNSIVAADFNGDGIDDIAVASMGTNCVSCQPAFVGLRIFAGLGAGGFGAAQEFLLHGSSLATGDVNRDGRPDLVLGGDSTMVLINEGGSFRQPARYPARSSNGGLVVGDVDRDGFDDVVVVSTDTTRILAGSATGTLLAAGILPFGLWDIATPVLADFDSDGGMDLVLPVYPNGFRVLWNAGAGLSSTPTFVLGGVGYLDRIAAADLDGDGKLDLLAASTYSRSDRVEIKWNLGARTWESARLYVEDHLSPNQWSEVIAYDFDQDGRLDVVHTSVRDHGNGGEVLGFAHVADRSFAALEEYELPGRLRGVFPSKLADGRGCLVILTPGVPNVMVARPDGSFEPAVPYPAAVGAYGIDWNGDGGMDLAIPRGNSVEIQLSGGAREVIPSLPTGPLLGHGDFNGDGLDDVLLRGPGQELLLALRDPMSGFVPAVQFPLGSDLPRVGSPLALGDFNRDGLCDVAEGAFDGDSLANLIIVYSSVGDGRLVRGFAVAVPPGLPNNWGPQPSQLIAQDVDGDGKLDIAFTGTYLTASSLVWVALGAGDGSFQFIPESLYEPAELFTCTLGDLTNDGIPDLFGISNNDGVGMGRFSFRRNIGGGRFEEPGMLHTVSIYPYGLSFADLNGDGRQDVIIPGSGGYPYTTSFVRVLLNVGRDVPTAVGFAPVRAVLDGRRARIEWFSPSRTAITGTVMRSENGGAWRAIGVAHADGAGVVAFTEEGLKAGSRYSYRLDYLVAGVAQRTATIDLNVPAASISLIVASGNPTSGQLRLSYVLPDAGAAELELFDIAGRCVDRKAILGGSISVGTTTLNGRGHLTSGVYWSRLTQGTRSVGTRVVLLP